MGGWGIGWAVGEKREWDGRVWVSGAGVQIRKDEGKEDYGGAEEALAGRVIGPVRCHPPHLDCPVPIETLTSKKKLI